MAAYTSRMCSLFASKYKCFIPFSLLRHKVDCKFSNIRYQFVRNVNIHASSSIRNSTQGKYFAKVCSIVGVGGFLWWLMEPVSSDSRNERQMQLSYDKSNEAITVAKENCFQFHLYQYQTCPFCCKVRAYLDYYGIPYEIIEVNPVLRQQIKFSKYKKVPILIANGGNDSVQINDSSVIISILATYFMNPKQGLQNAMSYYSPVTYTATGGKDVTEIPNKYYLMYLDSEKVPKSDDQIEEERKWRKWADDVLVHVLSPNVYRTQKEAMQAFRYFSEVGKWEENFAAWERYLVIYVGSSAMYFIGKRLKKRYNLKDDVRQSLYDACNEWMKAVGSKRKFMGGDKPNLADLAVYGVLSSIEGCDAFQDLLTNTKIGPWYQRMQNAVKSHLGKQ